MSAVANKAVFLSYASQDTEPARRICVELRQAGVEVWFDQSELRGGDAWDAKIKKQIRECALFLPVISANTNARAEGYFRLEWKLAVDRSHLMADDAPFIVPVAIDDIPDATARVPDRFREVQWTRLRAGETPAAFVNRVRVLLSGAAESVSKADSEIHVRAREFQRQHGQGSIAVVCAGVVGATRHKPKAEGGEADAPLPRHHAVARELLGRFPQAEVIGVSGASIFFVFAQSSDAVKFALLLYGRLRTLATETGQPVVERIGIHADEVAMAEAGDAGQPAAAHGRLVALAARVMSLGKAGQILLTRFAFDEARPALKVQDLDGVAGLSWANHGLYTLGGEDEPVEICEVAVALADALTPPAGTKQSRRTTATDHEPVLGWRPALGQTVPDTQWVLEKKLGEGGFGEVWLGRHQTMKERRVFKFCFQADRARSLKREMTLFRVIKERVGDHPNIVRLLEVHFNEAPVYVEMDYVDGLSLKPWCEQQGGVEKVPLPVRLDIVAQIADALQAAHEAGVIHRDVKPGNILVSQPAPPNAHPTAKLSDFGIGQVTSEEALQGMTKAGFTQSVLAESFSAQSGTQMYMAPELLAGEPASPRSDLYSLGVVLYQLVVGDLRRPLTTDWPRAIDDPLLSEDLARCFAGRPEERFASVAQLAGSLRTMEQRRAALAQRQTAAAARQRAAQRWKIFRTVGIAAVVVGLGTSLVWFLQRSSKLRWVRQQALPEINRLLQANEIPAAFALALEAEKYLPDDPALTSLWPRIAVKTSIETTPAGADVSIKEYRNPNSEWRLLGKSPLKNIRLPNAYFRWQIRKEGYEPVEQAAAVAPARKFSIQKLGEIPPDMVRVQGVTTSASGTGFASVQLEDYLMDRYEVTNRQFKEFIERGGYTNGNYWKQPFVKQENTLSSAEALAGFIDSTGKPGPATWTNGTYPEGQADHPVTGVSWFEAAAYAEFVGKRLPSIYHWRSAALVASYTSIVPFSNFSGKGLAPVGNHQGMSACGAYDMAGNAKEWCWNEARPGDRYILGGAWSEPEYMFSDADAQSQFNRSPLNGFRCMKSLSSAPLAERLLQPSVSSSRNYADEKPVSDEEFRIYRELYSYDKTPLNPRIEAVDDSDPRWRREKISFDAPYASKERMLAVVFLPKGLPPPYQPVIFFPGADALTYRAASSDKLVTMYRVEPIIQGGRALIYPIYWGTYERGTEQPTPPSITTNANAYREYFVHQAKDFRRSIDYLETRKDIQSDKLAFVGQSLGAARGAVLTALDDRIKVNVFVIGGFYQSRPPAQVDQINFAPRITIPSLMLNGNADFAFPLETSQKPMFRFLGTPTEHKRHVLYDSSHAVPIEPSSKELHDWLDKYLGPVK